VTGGRASEKNAETLTYKKMDNTKDNGGPAFPQPQGHNEDGAPYSAREVSGDSGMTLRDWFAGMALQGILASGTVFPASNAGDISLDAHKLADAMLAARKEDA
jgi:hypothetical protein